MRNVGASYVSIARTCAAPFRFWTAPVGIVRARWELYGPRSSAKRCDDSQSGGRGNCAACCTSRKIGAYSAKALLFVVRGGYVLNAAGAQVHIADCAAESRNAVEGTVQAAGPVEKWALHMPSRG